MALSISSEKSYSICVDVMKIFGVGLVIDTIGGVISYLKFLAIALFDEFPALSLPTNIKS